MKLTILSLNTWGGKLYAPLMDFVQRESANTEVFCFQEINSSPSGIENYEGMRADLFEQLSRRLPRFNGYFAAATSGIKEKNEILDISYGNALFVKDGLKTCEPGSFFVMGNHRAYDPRSSERLPRLAQHIQISCEGKPLTIINFHGIWLKGVGKGDTPERLEQSRKVQDFIISQPGPVILTGDFNLNPDTKSLKLLSVGLRNLILENSITSTRSSFYDKEGRFADYTLVSPAININEYSVLTDEVSDHLPQLLTVEW